VTIRVGTSDFDISAEMAALTTGRTGIGGVATFVGKVRDHADGPALASITLEHYPGMTEDELGRIEAEACRRFNLAASLIVHRIGELKPGDNIVLVIACASHRHDAFAAAGFLMDYLKTRRPSGRKKPSSTAKRGGLRPAPVTRLRQKRGNRPRSMRLRIELKQRDSA